MKAFRIPGLAAGTIALALLAPSARPDDGARAPSPPGEEPPAPKGKAQGPLTEKSEGGKGGKKGRRTPPEAVTLPLAGRIRAEEILRLAGELHGLPVEPESPRIPEVLLTVTPEMAGQRVGREEVKLLLAAQGIYLFSFEQKKGDPEGTTLIATRNPRWTPRNAAPRFIRKLVVPDRIFEAMAKELEDFLAAENQKLPEGIMPASAAMDRRTGAIIVRAHSEKVLKEAEAIQARLDPKGDGGTLNPGALHLYTYQAKFRKAEDLEEEIRRGLGEAQAARVSIVIPARSNALWIRSTEEIYRRVAAILERTDRPKGR